MDESHDEDLVTLKREEYRKIMTELSSLHAAKARDPLGLTKTLPLCEYEDLLRAADS